MATIPTMPSPPDEVEEPTPDGGTTPGSEPPAPNPAPGTDDDPQPRRGPADAAPMTPGARARPVER